MRKGLIFHECQQNTPEWMDLRRGKITSSTASVLLTDGNRSDKLGAGAINLAYRLAGEIQTGEHPLQEWTKPEVERGHDLEPIAIQAYEEYTWNEVNKIGFIQMGEYAGDSPDGMCIDHGVEIKCLGSQAHMKVVDNGPGNDYFAQVQWHMFVTGLDKWELVHFHPKFGNKSLIITECTPDPKSQDKFNHALEAMKIEINRLVEICQAKANAL